MSSTTQVTDFSDIYTDLLNRLREQTSLSASVTQAKRYVNIALQDMHIGQGEKFAWAERRSVLVTQQEYSTGTVSISQGSSTLTGSSTLWNTANAFSVTNARVGGKIVIAGGTEVYEVQTVSSDTSITLTSAFTQADVTAGSYLYFEDEYALDSDFLRPLDAQFFDEACDIRIIGRREFRQRHPRNKVTGKPLVATITEHPFSGNTTPVRKIRLWRPPDDFYSIPYAFVTNKLAVSSAGTEQTSLSADADEPIVPLRYRHVIVLHALYHWYRDKKDDQRSVEAKNEYTDLLLRITGDNEVGMSTARIQPKVGPYKNTARHPYRGRSGRYTTGTRFDELRD